jgi:hypothetical protein
MWLSFLVHDYLPLKGGGGGAAGNCTVPYIFLRITRPVSMKVNYVTF